MVREGRHSLEKASVIPVVFLHEGPQFSPDAHCSGGAAILTWRPADPIRQTTGVGSREGVKEMC